MDDSYEIPADPISISEYTIKRSRFITFLGHTDGVTVARDFVRKIKSEHQQARHHCWAWVAGAPNDSQKLGFSDDGEPSGTAGKPMLSQLMGSHMGEITALVVRYYGGIQLGTGGLVKAYGGSVQRALKALPRKKKTPMQSFRLFCDYAQLSDIERFIQNFGGQHLKSQFGQGIWVDFALPKTQLVDFAKLLSNFSKDKLKLLPLT